MMSSAVISNALKSGRSVVAATSVVAASLSSVVAPAKGADLGVRVPDYAQPVHASVGVPCDSPEARSFPSVWLGHFTGGSSAYTGPGGAILLDWHDDKLCFPSRRLCQGWVSHPRRGFHHPEGYYTCLVIR